MPHEKTDAALIWDMLEAAHAVDQFAKGKTFDDYLSDRMLRSAVERQIEILGEAARRVSDTFQSAHPEIPWRIIIAQRNVLAHEYGEIKHERIWRVVVQHLPRLATQLSPLVPKPPLSPDENG
ncbi:MAG: DUF86 domain-containing protein [Phycisphaerales bacterium]|jgi:uncharacterized protein with HEPN domain|nr:DUF86 domain-containing protein [Phycisphaerales bacterium]